MLLYIHIVYFSNMQKLPQIMKTKFFKHAIRGHFPKYITSVIIHRNQIPWLCLPVHCILVFCIPFEFLTLLKTLTNKLKTQNTSQNAKHFL